MQAFPEISKIKKSHLQKESQAQETLHLVLGAQESPDIAKKQS